MTQLSDTGHNGPAARDGIASFGVIVTGGGTGIGRVTAQALAERGARVLVVGRTDATLKETARSHPGIHCLTADIASPDAPGLIVETALREFGRIDVLVNNAVQTSTAMLGEIDRDTAQAQLATNLIAPIFLAQRALPALERSHGTIVNISTAASLGRRAFPGMSVYGSAKTALDFLTRTWAVELASRGIRVVAIAPGMIDTGIGERMGWSKQQIEQFVTDMCAHIPAGRFGRPEEIAWWIVQLISPQARYVTGTILAVDGAASNS